MMKNFRLILAVLAVGCICVGTSCRKKEKGNCYCSYVSGDRTHYNLKALSRSEQVDSCAVLDRNADGFGGSCKLK